jgi:hypothetical protein
MGCAAGMAVDESRISTEARRLRIYCEHTKGKVISEGHKLEKQLIASFRQEKVMRMPPSEKLLI